jgi:hypothetical protein
VGVALEVQQIIAVPKIVSDFDSGDAGFLHPRAVAGQTFARCSFILARIVYYSHAGAGFAVVFHGFEK